MAKPIKEPKKTLPKKKRKGPKSTRISASARNTNTIKIQIGDKRPAPRRASASTRPPRPPQIQQIPMPYPMYIPSIGQQSQQPVYATFNGRDNPSLLDKRIDNLTNGVEWLKEQMRQEIGDRVSMIQERLTVPSMVGDDVSDMGSYMSVPHWEDFDGVSSVEGNFETPVEVGEPELVPRSEERDGIESTQVRGEAINTPEAKPNTSGPAVAIARSVSKLKKTSDGMRDTYERAMVRMNLAIEENTENPSEETKLELKRARNALNTATKRLNERKAEESQIINVSNTSDEYWNDRRNETPENSFYRDGKYA